MLSTAPGRASSGLALTLLVGGCFHAGAERPLGVQEVLLRAKPAVVLIVAEVGAEVRANCGGKEVQASPPAVSENGTGWFIDARGLLITNAHVVKSTYAPSQELRTSLARRGAVAACLPVLLERQGLKRGQRREVEEQLTRLIHDTIAPTARVTLRPQLSVLLSNGTRLPAQIKKYTPPLTLDPREPQGRDLALLKIPGGDYPALPVGDSSSLKIGDPLYILGFPGVVLTHELLNQSATMEATVTNGAVSGFKQDLADQPVIQTDAPAAFGNSGGPAINAQGEVVGVLTFVSVGPGPEGGIVQGFNFVIPSTALREFIRGTEVTPGGPSRFNALWWAGLRDFFSDRFTPAASQFEATNRLHANLPDVKRMLAEAQEKIKNPPPKPFPWAWVALGITLASGSGFGAIWLRRWWRNRYRVKPAQVIGLMEKGLSPLFLDVRKQKEFEASPLKLPGAIRVAPEELAAGRIDLQVEPGQAIVAYCT